MHIGLLISGIVIVLVGNFMTFSPESVYYISEIWKSRGESEPSSFYITHTRIRGVICSLAGIALAVLSFFYEKF